MPSLRYLALPLASALALAAPRDAAACGGGFAPAPPAGEEFTIASQRMALSVSPTQTVLWSQIQYAGPPSDFAWVLPVGAGAVVEEAHDAWFDALEAVTTTHVRTTDACSSSDSGSSGCGLGCGSAAEDGGGMRSFGGEQGVQVVSQTSVGPYDSVILSSASGQAVQTWLTDHGFAVPAEMVPVLDAYAAEGLDFAALRLKPGLSTQQMSPVRVVTPGAAPVIPMRMMLAGAPAKIPVTLWVIGEGRYAPSSYPEAAPVDPAQLVWDFDAGGSNYADVRAASLAAGDGRGFLTTFAIDRAFQATIADQDGAPVIFDAPATGEPAGSLGALYFATAAAADHSSTAACGSAVGALEGGEVCEGASCPAGSQPPSNLVCGGWDDLAVALTGMRPGDVWVTRLEAALPRAGLSADLTLQPAVPQSPVSSWLSTSGRRNSDLAAVTTLWSTGKRPPRGLGGIVGLALAAGALLRRRERGWRRRQRPVVA